MRYGRMMAHRDVPLPEPVRLSRGLGALGVGSFDRGSGTWWWPTIVGGVATTLCVERTDAGVRGTAWGSGSDRLLDTLPELVGADDEVTISGADDRSRRLLEEVRGVRLGRTGDVHGAMVKAVLGQVVTTKEAKRSLHRLRSAVGMRAPGPREDLLTVPSAETLGALTYDELHAYGIERSRASTLIEVSRRASRLGEILLMDREAAYERLQAVRGVGIWTASLVMGIAWGDKDAVPIGDYHMPNAVAWALAGEDRGTDDRMLELLEPFRPERRRLVLGIKQTGVHAPRYGPRTAVRTHL